MLITEFQDMFSMEIRREPGSIPPMEISVDGSQWYVARNKQQPRIQSLLTPKPNGTSWRFTGDYRNVNKTQGHRWSLMREHIKRFIQKHCPFVEVYAVPDVSALWAARSLLQWIGRYGSPSQILSDNDTQFVNNLIEELLYIVGTEQCLTLAYSKEENAVTERANKEVRHLRNILFNQNVITNWSMYLPLVQRIFNAERKKSIGVSPPAELLFGKSIMLDRGVLLPKMTE
eukprot:gene11448-23941_t